MIQLVISSAQVCMELITVNQEDAFTRRMSAWRMQSYEIALSVLHQYDETILAN